MNLNDVLERVQHRARMSSIDEAMRATRAALTILGERRGGGEPGNLGAQRPQELARLLDEDNCTAEHFSSDELLKRINGREAVSLPKGLFHTRAGLAVLAEAVSHGATDDMRAQLPRGFQRLFEAGGKGSMGGA